MKYMQTLEAGRMLLNFAIKLFLIMSLLFSLLHCICLINLIHNPVHKNCFLDDFSINEVLDTFCFRFALNACCNMLTNITLLCCTDIKILKILRTILLQLIEMLFNSSTFEAQIFEAKKLLMTQILHSCIYCYYTFFLLFDNRTTYGR